MEYRCKKYRAVTTSIEGLVQQIALSYLRHGYHWYVTGTIPQRKDPCVVDDNVLRKYDIRHCWRARADNKARGIANLQYIRHGRFFVILATQGHHEFYEREEKRIRCAARIRGNQPYGYAPIMVPIVDLSDSEPKQRPGKQRRTRLIEGYSLYYVQGGYERKSKADREAYRHALSEWQRTTDTGQQLPKPDRGKRHNKWVSCVEIERSSYQRLRHYFLEMASQESKQRLEYLFRTTPYVPWQVVKFQILKILKEVNTRRKQAGIKNQLSYNTVLHMKRHQIAPFEECLTDVSDWALRYPSLADAQFQHKDVA